VAPHPELEAEQGYIDFAYDCVERTRAAALAVVEAPDIGPGGTFQARYERDVMWERMATRAAQLDFGNAPLCFGRIDFDPVLAEAPPSNGVVGQPEVADSERFYIGRTAVSDRYQNPVVVDWRAPIAEAFYRATGRDPMGLSLRRHFVLRGRELLGLDDELFGSAAAALDRGEVQGHSALITALESARTGKLSDIVATIQGEQDEIIRSALPGLLVVQGGPGTGKTVVALHRAAYLLYTHRFPLEDQGLLVLGPNRLFLNYIDQVLPSLGEAGAEIAVLGDLIPFVSVSARDAAPVAALKADERMVRLLARALRDRQRPLRRALRVPFGVQTLRLSVEQSANIVHSVRRRVRSHNAGRRQVEDLVFQHLADSSRQPVSAQIVRDRTRRLPEVREALERMWPLLTPAEFLNDLFGSAGLLRSAARGVLSGQEVELLARERRAEADEIVWSFSDAPLLDEAFELLGTHPRRKGGDRLRTYGHIVVDEAQDLSPMELRSIRRRSLNGSMTIVGDLAQATAPWSADDWSAITARLATRREPRLSYLRTGYRVPGSIMDLAARVLELAAPGISAPNSVRVGGEPPLFVSTDEAGLSDALVDVVLAELAAIEVGSLGVIVADSMVEMALNALAGAGLNVGRADRHGLDRQVTVVPVGLSKGLELDAVVVVEPNAILDEEPRGPQSLFVALTRCTRRLTLLAASGFPAWMDAR
jgi:DNA helicase IV